MIYLKISNNKGFYRIDEQEESWKEIDQINRDDLLKLLQLASETDFEIEEYEDELLQNPAHNIIYNNIYRKFKEFLDNKTRFNDSAKAMYGAALIKYSSAEEEA